MTTTPQVQPCPFCGNSGDRDPRQAFYQAPPFLHVQCGACSAMGPAVRPATAEAAAVEEWNRRATIPEPAAAPAAGEPTLQRLASSFIEPALAEDAARLDALSEAPMRDGWIVAKNVGSFTVYLAKGQHATRATLRAAIDAASQQPEHG